MSAGVELHLAMATGGVSSCPLCGAVVEGGDQLQLHYLTGCSAYDHGLLGVVLSFIARKVHEIIRPRQHNTTQMQLLQDGCLRWTLTRDILCSRQMLYQLSYRGSSAGWVKMYVTRCFGLICMCDLAPTSLSAPVAK